MYMNANIALDAARAELEATYDLAPSLAAAKETADRYQRVKAIMPEAEA